MKYHTVKSLIAHLQALPPDLPVFVTDGEGVSHCEFCYKSLVARRPKGEDGHGGSHQHVTKFAKRKRLAVVIC